ncbi:MAG: hypothetical protein LBF85_10005 [Tannerella sp.]|jgi:hypothetical protein|nr:hypothetical protein [Tannerella sp.]
MKQNVPGEKSFKFAVKTVVLYRHLCMEKKESVLSGQVLRSGTPGGVTEHETESLTANH